jgi:Flp pilus assembly protein TadG
VIDAASRRGRGDEGTVTLPMIVLFPVLLFTVLFVVQVGIWQYYRQAAAYAAQDGATAAARAAGTSADPATAAASAVASGQAESTATATLTRLGVSLGGLAVTPSVSGPDRVKVTVSGSFPSIFGFHLDVSASAARPVEVFRPAP